MLSHSMIFLKQGDFETYPEIWMCEWQTLEQVTSDNILNSRKAVSYTVGPLLGATLATLRTGRLLGVVNRGTI